MAFHFSAKCVISIKNMSFTTRRAKLGQIQGGLQRPAKIGQRGVVIFFSLFKR